MTNEGIIDKDGVFVAPKNPRKTLCQSQEKSPIG